MTTGSTGASLCYRRQLRVCMAQGVYNLTAAGQARRPALVRRDSIHREVGHVLIRPARDEDTAALLGVERAAFGGESEADLVAALLADPSALPLINLVAEDDGEIVGHVLFTARGGRDCRRRRSPRPSSLRSP